MTTLAPPPPGGPVPPTPPPSSFPAPRGAIPPDAPRLHHHEHRRTGRRSAGVRTLIGLLASALAILPLKTLFSDTGWLVDAWSAMAVVLLPAALLRVRRAAGALDIWPGIVLLVPYLTLRFLRAHAWGGFVPTGATWHQVSRLMTALHRTTHDDVAPVHTTVAIRLVLCALVGLLAALIDLVAVVGHRGALAGVPMLVVFTISGAVPRTPVPWFWFVFAAVGFLLLLALGADDEVEGWGRRIRSRTRRSSTSSSQLTASVTAQRIAIGALAAAVVLPLLAPSHARNLLANAFHHRGTGVGGFGGDTTGGSISPFAALKGQLVRGSPVKLMSVHVQAPAGETPFYLRVNVLAKYEPDGWHVSDYGPTTPLGEGLRATTGAHTVTMRAHISISGLQSNVPVFALPRSVSGIPAGTDFSSQDDLLLGSTVQPGQQIDETFDQPEPTLAQLRAAPDDPRLAPRIDVPGSVTALVRQLTAHTSGPYERALAIQHYFISPQNHFVYDLTSSVGDSGSALVDFLQGKHGYCQQFAAAMAVMLQVSGIPSRVVLGYMHDAPDADGNFTVTSDDAHAWVEAYFDGLGWIPFDPTPPAGLTLGAENSLSWAPDTGGGPQNPGLSDVNGPHATGSGSPTSATPSTRQAGAGQHPTAHAAPASGGGLSASAVLIALLVVVVLLVLLIPALLRLRRRRRRLAAGRRGDTEALWAELSDTAVDLGYVWSPARSPRQVAQWLGRDVRGSREALQTLVAAVEHGRYAPPSAAVGRRRDTADGRDLQDRLRAVTDELRQRRTGRTRLGATLLPASLTRSVRWWPRRIGPRRRR